MSDRSNSQIRPYTSKYSTENDLFIENDAPFPKPESSGDKILCLAKKIYYQTVGGASIVFAVFRILILTLWGLNCIDGINEQVKHQIIGQFLETEISNLPCREDADCNLPANVIYPHNDTSTEKMLAKL